MEQLIWQDEAGNKAYKKYISSRKTWQYYVKNKQGKLVNEKDTLRILNKIKAMPKVKKGHRRKEGKRFTYNTYGPYYRGEQGFDDYEDVPFSGFRDLL